MIKLNAKLILIRLFFIDLFFIVVHLVSVNIGLPEALVFATVKILFNLNGEHNIPAWFSASQLVLLAFLALVRSDQLNDRDQDKQTLRRLYLLMGGVFLFFSLDEIISIHESLTELLIHHGINSPFFEGNGAWIFVYPAVFFVVLWFLRGGLIDFLKETPGRRAYLLGAAVFVLGGIVFETLGYYLDDFGLKETHVKRLEVVLEEGCELLGQSTMVYALLVKLGSFSATPKGS
jgi:hypothetical protein